MTQNVNGERDYTVNLYALTLDCLTVPGDKRLPLQPSKVRHSVVADQDEISRRLTGVIRVSWPAFPERQAGLSLRRKCVLARHQYSDECVTG